MRVQTDFEIKHFIELTHLNGGTLEILFIKDNMYKVKYDNDMYSISYDALQQIKLLNQNLVIKNRIVQ